MTCAAAPIDVVAVLASEGPLDTETVSRRLRVTPSGARRVLGAREAAGAIRKINVVTPKYRRGVHIWYVADESQERIDAAIAELRRRTGSFNNRPFAAK